MNNTTQTSDVIVLTGATSGIGEAVAHRLAREDRRLIVQGPEPPEAVRDLLSSLRNEASAEITYVSSDYSDLSSVVAAADEIVAASGGRIAALINDAAIPGPVRRQVTADGHERTLQINFLAMALLTELLRSHLDPVARVVNLSSATHEMVSLDLDDIDLESGYTPVRAYARSKLAILMYTRWNARHRPGGSTWVSLNPGVINTQLLHAMFGSIGGPVERGAENVLDALQRPARGGEYFDGGRLVAPSAEAREDAIGDALMAWTFEVIAPHLGAPPDDLDEGVASWTTDTSSRSA